MGVRGKQSFPRLAERGGSRSLRTSFRACTEVERSDCRRKPALLADDCPRPQLAKEQRRLAAFVGSQARPIQQRTEALEGLGTPSCTRAGWQLAAAPVLRGFASQDTNADWAHTGKGLRPSMAAGPSRAQSSEREEVSASRRTPTNPQRPQLAGDS